MTQRIVNADFTRGEAISALVWLSVGSLFGLLLQVVYLGTWISLPGGTQIAFPYTIVLAFLFNMVLTRTARLWTDSPGTALIPLYAWIAGFFLLMFGVEITGDQLILSSFRTIGLLLAGIAGGFWPLARGK
ncbi:hypothetical protein [Corynebacterium alimapuense]|uniref:Uncharacterized protein n=1 Tax=Corynebacterium alimapuense TaxID=1576874 RepID=A0A3M8K5H3_9CORY|nr:hypothetical protein [Corynebacterium alimapuense]RNE48473.1 hypothetical protein C5L39_08190 [Corynebacterium alimapuense]